MDQSLELRPGNRRHAVERLAAFVADSVRGARSGNVPFDHLEFDQVFPDDIYAAMLETMPVAADYRPLAGRGSNWTDDGQCTRVKIDLFPEYLRHLVPQKRAVWDVVGAALCSRTVLDAFRERLGPALARRFGPRFADVGMYPIPVLMRDIPGYRIAPHPDTHWKGITAQFYLPKDASIAHVGTIFHERLPNNTFPKRAHMKFLPNTGYAFAVDRDTWHSADEVGPEVKTRDSIIITYFVDAGVVRFFRNRGKRIGNFLLNEVRSLAGGLRR
jgi:hypothetical protein